MTRPMQIALAGAWFAVLTGCGNNGETVYIYNGYAEGEYVRLASPFAGRLAALNVRRGDTVSAGAPLFALEQENERAARQEAEARVKRAAAQLENLRTGKRPAEVETVRNQLVQAQASLKLSAADLKRQQQLVAAKLVSLARLDEARAAYERDRARVAELSAQIKVAMLAARPDEIAAAQAEVAMTREALAQAQWKLGQKTLSAPQAALVADTLYRQGEWVPAGMPVVSLLPAENIKVRFFVPEKELGAVRMGQRAELRCDGCQAPMAAQVSFIAPQAEYTPPVIYSKESRAKLVFLVEAWPAPAEAARLHPGQPVEVRLRQADPGGAK